MKSIEQLAKEIQKDLARDGEVATDAEALEMAKMELGAKEIRRYEKSSETKEKKKREIKLDEMKVKIISEIDELLADADLDLEDLTIVNPQKEITFKIGEDKYSINLVKHRPKKK